MRGMDINTGKWIEGKEYLLQCIRLTLLTPKGSRLINKDFGSTLLDLVDSGSRDLASYAIASARALQGLPEFRLRKVSFAESSQSSRIELVIQGDYLPTSEIIQARVTP